MKNSKALIALTAIGLFASSPAYAYVDPGSGTLILQLLAAAGVGAIFYFRQFRDKVMSLFSGRSEVGQKNTTDEPKKDD